MMGYFSRYRFMATFKGNWMHFFSLKFNEILIEMPKLA